MQEAVPNETGQQQFQPHSRKIPGRTVHAGHIRATKASKIYRFPNRAGGSKHGHFNYCRLQAMWEDQPLKINVLKTGT